MLNPAIWIGLLSNAAWLLALFIIYDMGHRFLSKEGRWSPFLDGILIAGICMAVMLLPYYVVPGLFYDSRSILISVTGLFFGPVPTTIVMGVAGIFRGILGGPGVYAGISAIISSGLIGLAWHYWVKRGNRNITWRNLYLMGLLVHMFLIIEMQLLSEVQRVTTREAMIFPLLVIYPVFTVVLGLLLRQQQEKKQFIADMKASEEKYRSLMENVSDVVWRTDMNLKTTYVSPSIEKLVGEPHEVHSRKTLEEKLPPQSIEKLKQLFAEELLLEQDPGTDKERSREIELEHYHADGSIIWIGMKLSFLRDEYGNPIGIQGVSRDITRRRKSEEDFRESQRSREVLLDNLPGMAYRCNYDKDWTMTFVSKGCYDLTGYQAESIVGSREITFNEIILPKYHDHLWKQWEKVLKNHGKIQEEYQIQTAQGQIKWVFEQGQGVFDEKGQVVALEGLIIDITDRKENEIKIRHLYNHNDLTDLPNLRSLEETFPEILAGQSEGTPGILMVNLRRFSVYNRIFGYREGNHLIRHVGACLKDRASSDALLFHVSIDRFVYLLPTCGSREELEGFGKELMDYLHSCIHQQSVCFSIGILGLEPPVQETVEILLRRAAVAAEQVNEHHRIGMEVFSLDMEQREERDQVIRQGLALAVLEDEAGEENSGLFVMVQPVVQADGTAVHGFEALARFRHPKLGIVSPGEFIPLAESSQLMIPVGRRIIHRVCDFALLLDREGYPDLPISFNVSAIQLLTEGFLEELEDLFRMKGVSPRRLNLEITESIFSDNFQLINEQLEKIRSLGMKVSIDDFGTGYSSLAREEELMVDVLKIDKYFIDKLMGENPERSIVADIISMAHKLGQKVVAEGVETEIQRQYLEKHGCDFFQGYLFSRPVMAMDAIKLIKQSLSEN